MNTIFTRGPSITIRLVIALVLSVVLIVADHRFDAFSSSKVYLNSLVTPLQYLASLPEQMLSASASRLASHQRLLHENRELVKQATLMNEKLQRYTILQQENNRLRKLLGSPVRQDMQKMIAELMAVDNNPFSHQIVIDKGAIHGVYEGQSVLDSKGIAGQILDVGTATSRVLLIADLTHAIPVRIERNDVRIIATGAGRLDELLLEHVPHSADVQEGDVLISSGLGNVFPEGYPVAKITSIVRDEGRPFAQVRAEPMAQLDRLKYLLLLWPENAPKQPVFAEEG
ncbi:rod shape-determining protein MreC [Aestuariibacter sp. AA17]|uniref:Cell shape-determining protein MreC n=1 Tax=Fluctibacter corallii TaxID=2984329 RepID=A0ABT3AAY6_9ALTE|nr:rod shape-determining protein MreC [Aestuariibacter sp. AA17]MCV2885774.1 rod shape-determining protein MreC [Aestuariibacter sp. AA17]